MTNVSFQKTARVEGSDRIILSHFAAGFLDHHLKILTIRILMVMMVMMMTRMMMIRLLMMLMIHMMMNRRRI